MSRNKIYKAFFKEKKIYYNQLKKITNLSYSSLQNSIKKLIKNKEITIEKINNHTYYQLTNKYKAIEFTKISLDLLNDLNTNVKIPVKEFLEIIPDGIFTIILFGSCAKKQEKKDSDIDLLIVFEEIEPQDFRKMFEKTLKEKIISKSKEIITKFPFSFVFTSKKDFFEQKDYLIKEAKEKGFPIYNQQRYYNECERIISKWTKIK